MAKHLALTWAGEHLGAHIEHYFPGRRLAIVPIPGHTSISTGDVEAGRVFAIAKVCAATLAARGVDAAALPLLQWRQAMPSAHSDGGSRNPNVCAARTPC